MLMYSQSIITGSAAAASDAVHILKSLQALHAAALSLLPAAELAAKRIVLLADTGAKMTDRQEALPLVTQIAGNVFAAARLFSDSVGLHVNSIGLQLLQSSSGLDEALHSAVVTILAAVYRSNCTTPLPAFVNCCAHLAFFSRWRRHNAPQGYDIRITALYTHLPGSRGKLLHPNAFYSFAFYASSSLCPDNGCLPRRACSSHCRNHYSRYRPSGC
jgi:hypothetical protein